MTNYELKLLDVSCASCVKTITQALEGVKAIKHFDINFAQRTVNIETDASPNLAIDAIKKAGYTAILNTLSNKQEKEAEADAANGMFYKAAVAGIIGIAIMIIGWTPLTPSLTLFSGQMTWGAIGIVTLLIMAYAGGSFYKSAWAAFIKRNANMDTLISLGTLTAWIYSAFIVALPLAFPETSRHVFFEASLIILAFINLGGGLEVYARGKTSEAIKHLLDLQAKVAHVVRAKEEVDIPIEEVKANDILRVKPGERIPVDGVITEGHIHLDESMLTGESVPASKTIGDTIYAGTLNGTTSFLFKATGIGEQTLLAQIIKLVKNAQNTKPSIARLADQVSAYFVPSVLIISVITALVWFNFGPSPVSVYMLITALSVLVIACPCALGLAAPISIVAGVGKAAEQGLLIRNGEALQRASHISTLVLDKTGTITQGSPVVTNVLPSNDFSKEDLIKIAASVEQYSEHPLAHAIVQEAKSKTIELTPSNQFKSITGKGVVAQHQNQNIAVGKQTFIEEQLSSKNNNMESLLAKTQANETVIFISVNSKFAGLIAISDPIKKDSKEAIARLKRLNIEVIMLTGDNKRTAQTIANSVGITHVISEVLPTEKSDAVNHLKKPKKVIAMAGDGINDAPALATADVSFAMAKGADIAIESADITLMRNSLNSIADAILVSKATMRNIKQNLFGAFIYNIIGIPIAAGVLYPWLGVLLSPMIAAAAMAASSLTVVTNANRLRFFTMKRR